MEIQNIIIYSINIDSGDEKYKQLCLRFEIFRGVESGMASELVSYFINMHCS